MKYICLLLAACCFLMLAISFVLLPDKIATHFDIQNQANGWMTKTEYTAFTFLMLLVCIAVEILIYLCARFCPPEGINVPHPDYWKREENLSELRNRIIKMFVWEFGVFLFVSMLFVEIIIILANQQPPKLPAPFFVVLISIIGISCWTIWCCFRFRIPKDNGQTQKTDAKNSV